MPYLVKGPRPDINNRPGVIRIVSIFWPRRLFESDSNNCPSMGHSNFVSDKVYICSDLPFLISWWLPYLAKGPMLDFNNGPGTDLNSIRSLASQRLFETYLNNAPQAIPTLCQMENTYGFLVGAISVQGLHA